MNCAQKSVCCAAGGTAALRLCVAPAGRGPAYVVAPALPLVVALGVEPYYYRSGFYYYYHDNRWSYARAKHGPWRDLPRDLYPGEVRHQGHGYDNDGGHHHDYH